MPKALNAKSTDGSRVPMHQNLTDMDFNCKNDIIAQFKPMRSQNTKNKKKHCSDTGSRTRLSPVLDMKAADASRYTISDLSKIVSIFN